MPRQRTTSGVTVADPRHRWSTASGLHRWSTASGFAICSAALLLVIVLRAAWLCDDAFITLRTIDNWVGGHGLRWNVSERVQSFTHPAWLFVVAAIYAPSGNPTFALLLPGMAATAVFIAAFTRMAGDPRLGGAVCLLFLASKAFVEFSTSGLENPLVHVILLGYLVVTEHAIRSRTRLWPVVTTAALLLLTRIDLIWLIGPSLLGAAWRARRELLHPRTWLGLTPLLLWELFSLLYYGFPFPNTAYAKLSTGVPASEAIAQGLIYLQANLRYDPVTLPAIALASACGFASRRLEPSLLALGLLTWQAYLVRIGGDFMIGRLLTPALVVAGVLLLRAAPLRAHPLLPWASIAVVLVGSLLPRTALHGAPPQHDDGWLPEGVTDERAIFHGTTGLFRTTNPEGPRSHPYTQEVLRAAAKGKQVIAARSIGFAGYYAGPSVHLVDEFALAEPLLARLPADPTWGAGHFARQVPEGYLATLESGKNQLAEPTLRRRYSELALIISGPIFSAPRLATVASWNIVRPRVYPMDYQVRHVTPASVRGAPEGGASVRAKGVLTTDRQGLAVVFEDPTLTQSAVLSLGGDDHYWVSFRRGETILWTTKLTPSEPNRNRLKTYQVTPPEPVLMDSLLIRGRRGDGRYHVGSVKPDPAQISIEPRRSSL